MRAIVLFLVGCSATVEVDDDPADTSALDDTSPIEVFADFPEPDAWSVTGPGLGQVTFETDELFQACAHLAGDPARSVDHHNLAVMYDGYLVMPWAPEWGAQRDLDWETCGLSEAPTPEAPGDVAACEGTFGGGITLWDVSSPCEPTKVGEGWSPWMRESHSLGFAEVEGRTYMAVDFLALDGSGGVGFWDLTDRSAPEFVSWVRVPGHRYPDSYLLLTLSVFWQGRYLYASSAGHGVFVIDVLDPLNPVVVDAAPEDDTKMAIKLQGGGIHHGGTFHVFGNRAMASAAGIESTFLVDLSDPVLAEVELGGAFAPQDAEGGDASYYFANLGLDYGLFARSDSGGGPVIMDITDPSSPTHVADLFQADGDGGYIFQHNDVIFQGESNFGAVYDFDGTTLNERGRFALKGDLDTVTPLGNLALVSVDEGANPGEATAIVPWREAPDDTPPTVGMRSPTDGEQGLPTTTRVGFVLDEMIEPMSAFRGSVRLATEGGEAVDALVQVQENVVNLSPRSPLEPGTTYLVELPAGGLADLSGNRLVETVSWTFHTAP